MIELRFHKELYDGFAVDEAPTHLGEALILPPWLEPARGQIESVLPPLRPAG